MTTPTPRRRVARVTGLRRPQPPAPAPAAPATQPSRLKRAISTANKIATWDGWQKSGALVAALGVLVGFYFTNQTLRTTVEQNQSTRYAQTGDQYTKAVAALDSTGAETRIGAIFTLEQIAKDSPELNYRSMYALSMFLQDRAQLDPDTACDHSHMKSSPDIDAALNALSHVRLISGPTIKITGVCLGSNVTEMDFDGAGGLDIWFLPEPANFFNPA